MHLTLAAVHLHVSLINIWTLFAWCGWDYLHYPLKWLLCIMRHKTSWLTNEVLCDLRISSLPCRQEPRSELGPVSWRPTTVKWRQFSMFKRHSTISTRQTEYHEALPSSANDEVRCDCTFADNGNASWYSVCREPMVKWWLDCEYCRHLTVVGLHDTGPRLVKGWWSKSPFVHRRPAADVAYNTVNEVQRIPTA